MAPALGRILVTPRSLTAAGERSAHLEPLRRAGYEIVIGRPGQTPSAAELRTLLPGVVGWLAGVEPITADLLEVANQLKVISRNGTGTDSIDLEAARFRGIRV